MSGVLLLVNISKSRASWISKSRASWSMRGHNKIVPATYCGCVKGTSVHDSTEMQEINFMSWGSTCAACVPHAHRTLLLWQAHPRHPDFYQPPPKMAPKKRRIGHKTFVNTPSFPLSRGQFPQVLYCLCMTCSSDVCANWHDHWEQFDRSNMVLRWATTGIYRAPCLALFGASQGENTSDGPLGATTTLVWGQGTTVSLLDCRILKGKLWTLFRVLFAL